MDPTNMAQMFEMMNNPECMKQMEQMMKQPEVAKLLKNKDLMKNMVDMITGESDDTSYLEKCGKDITEAVEMNNVEPEADAEADAPMICRFSIDDNLVLTGLKDVSYEGKPVKVINYNTERQRYQVHLLDEPYNGKQLLVKEINLVEPTLNLESNSECSEEQIEELN